MDAEELQPPENSFIPFSMRIDVQTEDDLLGLTHIGNLSRRELIRTIRDESSVPTPKTFNVVKLFNVCFSKLQSYGMLKEDVGQEDTGENDGWLPWEFQKMKPGFYEIRGTTISIEGFSAADRFAMVNNGLVLPVWSLGWDLEDTNTNKIDLRNWRADECYTTEYKTIRLFNE